MTLSENELNFGIDEKEVLRVISKISENKDFMKHQKKSIQKKLKNPDLDNGVDLWPIIKSWCFYPNHSESAIENAQRNIWWVKANWDRFRRETPGKIPHPYWYMDKEQLSYLTAEEDVTATPRSISSEEQKKILLEYIEIHLQILELCIKAKEDDIKSVRTKPTIKRKTMIHLGYWYSLGNPLSELFEFRATAKQFYLIAKWRKKSLLMGKLFFDNSLKIKTSLSLAITFILMAMASGLIGALSKEGVVSLGSSSEDLLKIMFIVFGILHIISISSWGYFRINNVDVPFHLKNGSKR